MPTIFTPQNAGPTFTIRIDAVVAPREPVADNDWYARYTKVDFTVLTGFDHEHRCNPQFRIAVGDQEGARVSDCSFTDATHRTGSYYLIADSSKYQPDQELTATIRTQLDPAITPEDVIRLLQRAPAALCISFYPGCAWLHFRNDGPGKADAMEFVPDPRLIVEMLRDGQLQLDCGDTVVLRGFAKSPDSKAATRKAAIEWMIGPEAKLIWPKRHR